MFKISIKIALSFFAIAFFSTAALNAQDMSAAQVSAQRDLQVALDNLRKLRSDIAA